MMRMMMKRMIRMRRMFEHILKISSDMQGNYGDGDEEKEEEEEDV